MPLEQQGRVVLKIYNQHRQLMIARPCASHGEAEKYFTDYVARYATSETGEFTCEIAAMVPRI